MDRSLDSDILVLVLVLVWYPRSSGKVSESFATRLATPLSIPGTNSVLVGNVRSR